jgi:hypothetical protein
MHFLIELFHWLSSAENANTDGGGTQGNLASVLTWNVSLLPPFVLSAKGGRFLAQRGSSSAFESIP